MWDLQLRSAFQFGIITTADICMPFLTVGTETQNRGIKSVDIQQNNDYLSGTLVREQNPKHEARNTRGHRNSFHIHVHK